MEKKGAARGLTRRALVGGLAALVASCRHPPHEGAVASAALPVPEPLLSPPPPEPEIVPAQAPAPAPTFTGTPAPPEVAVQTLAFGPAQGGPQEAVVLAPKGGAANARYPLLVALGGLGETHKGMSAGAAGWLNDYWLDRAMKRLCAPPLTSGDFQNIVDPARLEAINASLAARPYRGLVVACPFTPDLVTKKSLDNAGPFAHFVVKRLLPRVRKEAPVETTREATGLDGVSLGGRLSLLVGLAQPKAFGAVGVMQAAVYDEEVEEIVKRLAAMARRGGPRVRLLTSDEDFYRDTIEAIHAALADAGVAHDHLLVPGPHGYEFNRGPGGIEMLLWHDRVLRGEAPDV